MKKMRYIVKYDIDYECSGVIPYFPKDSKISESDGFRVISFEATEEEASVVISGFKSAGMEFILKTLSIDNYGVPKLTRVLNGETEKTIMVNYEDFPDVNFNNLDEVDSLCKISELEDIVESNLGSHENLIRELRALIYNNSMIYS